MLQVMIVDDKKNIIEGMRNLIHWEEYGYQVVQTVRSGKCAIEVLEKQPIDLCITDIRMPGMSGMELIEYAKKLCPHTKFVILSGYDEFEYAKRALEYQVCGYLLKPVDEEELIEILIRIKKEIELQKEYTNQVFWRKVQGALSDQYSDFDGMDEAEEMVEIRYISVNFTGDRELLAHMPRYEDEKFSSYIQKLEEILGKNTFDYVLKGVNRRDFILDLKTLNGGLKFFLEQLKRLQNQTDGQKLVIFIGKEINRISDSKRSQESIQMLSNVRFYESSQRIFVYEDYDTMVFSEFISDNDLIPACITAIKMKDTEQVRLAVEKLFFQIKQDKIRVQNVFMYAYNIIFSLGNTVIENGGDISKCLYKWSLVEKTPLPDLEMLRECFLDIAIELKDILSEQKNKNILGTVGTMLEYIHENYNDENLNLQYLSQKYHITPSYLGRVFKQKFHMSFNKYLTKLRIDKAKDLLENTDYKVYEVASMVGYNDPNYFHVKFTETEKITPAKYREMKTGERMARKEKS